MKIGQRSSLLHNDMKSGTVVCCYSECISTPGKLKNQPDHGGNRTRDLWFASPMLYQLSYEVKYVRVFDISELSLAPSISVCF